MIPARIVNRLLVQGVIKGRTLWFHLDTGSSGLVLSVNAARSLGFATAAGGKLTTDLDVGTLHARGAVFEILDYRVRDGKDDVSGIIGAPFFRSNVVTLDFPRGLVIVYPRGSPLGPSPGSPVPLAVERGVPHVRVTWGGEPARLLLDVGSAYTFLFPSRAARIPEARPAPGPALDPVSLGIGRAPVRVRQFSAPPIRIADAELRLATVLVPDEVPLGLRDDDGIFGRDACRGFAITLDYTHGIAYFR